MATSTYTGSWPSSLGLNAARTCSVSGGSSASGVINFVNTTLIHSTNAYSKSYDITVTVVYSGGAKSVEETIKMDSSNYGGYSHTYTITGLTVTQANSISSIIVQCTGGSSGYSASNVYVKSNVTVSVDYTVPSKVSTPTIGVGTTKTTGSTVAVSWTASSDGTANTLTGYILQYRDSSNGSSWGNWTNYAAYGTGTRSVTASLPDARNYRQFRVCATGSQGSDYYSDYSQSSSILRCATPTTPGNFAVAPTTWESGDVSLSWDASTATGASISKYYLEYCLKSYGGSYGSWATLTNTTSRSYSHNPGLSKGDNIQYRVRAYSSDEIYSSYSSTVTVIRETDKPTSLKPEAGWYENITSIAWELPASISLTGTTSQYRYSTDSGSTWSSWTSASGTSVNVASIFSDVSSGAYFQFQVRAVQTNGDVTDAAMSGTIYKNTAPAAPSILAPVPASPVSPGAFWVVLSVTADPNEHSFSVSYQKDSGDWTTIKSGLTAAAVLAVKLSAGGTYVFRCMDVYGAASTTTRTITVNAETYTDSPIVAGTTRIKAAHINELRARIEQLCALYDAIAPTWAETIVAGTTSVKNFPTHITELRTALEALYTKINGLGAGTIVSAPTWETTLTDVRPKATAIEEIRAAVRAI